MRRRESFTRCFTILPNFAADILPWAQYPRHRHSSIHGSAAITIHKILQPNGKDSLSLLKHWWGSQRGEHLFVSLIFPSYFLHLHEALVLCVGAYRRSDDFCSLPALQVEGSITQPACNTTSFSRKLSEYGHVAEFAGHSMGLLCC